MTNVMILCLLASIVGIAILRVRAVVRGEGRDDDIDFTKLARTIYNEEKEREKERKA